MMPMGRLAFLALALALAATASAATNPVRSCQAAKVKAATKKVLDEGKCQQKALLKDAAVDPACLLKAEAKFATAVIRAGLQGVCEGTAADLGTDADAYVDKVLARVSCSGEPVAGACWFLGTLGESCDATCATHGAAYDPATRSLAGSDGNAVGAERWLNCLSVMAAFRVDGAIATNLFPPAGGLGCIVGSPYGVATIAIDVSPTTSTAAVESGQRACACL